ncbi:glycoside hydrolase family 5 protein [Irpex rosettiformis]|uniref:Glycoside hydrolase family 5 protein n=1 Tax=Irpex rosettiformis TaxID=378272 RepID=A0ACB8UBK2_9APHY|nr:glycoside hydrolase family 5 protein [Irpex rosettiformis]
MKVYGALLALLQCTATILASVAPSISGPDKIYGVNLGSWLVLEAWMLPAEWAAMGGETCDDCSQCIASEFAYAQAYPKTVDFAFAKHWPLKDAGINTVRIPLGYWIIEALVDRKTEYFPRGGLRYLQRGLNWLKTAGIQAILDHHALPGVQTAGQQFTGRCTQDVEFYTDYNYHRALVWTAVMTTISHLDPSFDSVFAIEAVNEPIMDATKTPGYGDFQKNFVNCIRAVELLLGITVPGETLNFKLPSTNITDAFNVAASSSGSNIFNDEIRSVLKDAVPILTGIVLELGILNAQFPSALVHSQRTPLVANFMDINWQHNNPANPADAAIGPQGYDNHLYYSFGGVADPTEEAYLTSICNLQRVQADAALGNTPLWFGEWGLPTQFQASDEFLFKWADAQKLAYSQGKGWIFWNFKTEISEQAGDLSRQWSYLDGLKRGYLTQDPSQYNDARVCDSYRNSSTSKRTNQDLTGASRLG